MASKGTKKKQFKGRWIINVICQHIDCLLSTTWKQRVSIKTFRASHWKKKHNGDKELKDIPEHMQKYAQYAISQEYVEIDPKNVRFPFLQDIPIENVLYELSK